MFSKHDPVDTLADIVENGERIAEYVAGMDDAAFAADRRTRDAVERCLERVCEASRRPGDLAVALMPGQPWGDIRGMGNRLRHGYDGIEEAKIWKTVHSDLPGLTADARRALERLQPPERLAEPS